MLYVDGYPRWEYRYIKNEMIRDVTVNIACLLTSADPTFAQEGDPPDEKFNFPGPIRRFGPIAWTRDAIVMVQENDEGTPTLVRWRFQAGEP